MSARRTPVLAVVVGLTVIAGTVVALVYILVVWANSPDLSVLDRRSECTWADAREVDKVENAAERVESSRRAEVRCGEGRLYADVGVSGDEVDQVGLAQLGWGATERVGVYCQLVPQRLLLFVDSGSPVHIELYPPNVRSC